MIKKLIFIILLLVCTPAFSKEVPDLNSNVSPTVSDLTYTIDVSDTDGGSTGTGKKATIKQIFTAGNIDIDGTNVGINSASPSQALDVIGSVKATTFIGDGSGLSGVSGTVSDTVYGVGWDGDTTTGASKNALYDKIETISSGTGGLTDNGTNINLTTSTDNVGIGTATARSRLTVNDVGRIESVDGIVYSAINAAQDISMASDLTTGSVRNIESIPVLTGANSVGTFSAVYGIAWSEATNATFLTHHLGLVGRAFNRSTGSTQYLSGVYGDFQQKGGVVTNAASFWASGGNVVLGGTITNAYAFLADVSHDSSNSYITNNYGIKIGDYITTPRGDNNNIGLLIGTAPSGPMNAAINVTAGNSLFVANVGIGSTAPSTTLDVVGTGRFSSTLTASNLSGTNTGDQTTISALAADGANCSAGNYPLGVDAYGAVQDCTSAGGGGAASGWTDGGTNVFTSTTTDVVGIGTTTPTAAGSFEIVKNASLKPLMISSAANAGGDYLVVTSVGNVGIGTINPTNLLSVGSTSTFFITSGGALTAGNITGTAGSFTTSIKGGTSATSSLNLLSTSGSGTSDFIKFSVGSNGSTESMRIINGGNVGIGTTTPRGAFVVATGNVGIGTVYPNGTFALQPAAAQAGQATCWTTNGVIGYCTSVVSVGGGCSCSPL